MKAENRRVEILDLLARGKLTIDEALTLLDLPFSSHENERIGKAESTAAESIAQESGQEKVTRLAVEEIPDSAAPDKLDEPRWLRIQVDHLSTGKSKVRVNLPFGMVRFGLGMARLFAPQEVGPNLAQLESAWSETGSGLVLEVQDDESNEHVRIYFE